MLSTRSAERQLSASELTEPAQTGTSSLSTATNRLPVGAPTVAQQNTNASTVASSYRGARGARGRTSTGPGAAFSTLRA